MIDVELLEVDRQRLRDYGLQFASPGSPGIDGFAGIDESNLTLSDIGNLTGADIFVANLPGLFYRLLKRDQDTRTLANPHLRASAGLAANGRIRRAHTNSCHPIHPFRRRRCRAAADYVVQL